MGVTNIPNPAGGGIKSVQRGQAVSAGDITITSVNTSKTFVESFSEGASGTVALSATSTGTLTASGGNIAGVNPVSSASSANINNAGTFATYGGTRTLSGGTMDATTAEMGVYLKNSTTLTATGACRYQIVEFA